MLILFYTLKEMLFSRAMANSSSTVYRNTDGKKYAIEKLTSCKTVKIRSIKMTNFFTCDKKLKRHFLCNGQISSWAM